MRDFWVLGAADPEMNEIERLLRVAGTKFIYATVGGRRVRPGQAYRIDPVGVPRDVYRLVLVECGWPDQPHDAVIIDHHRPGDPGYGRQPAEFMWASSIGQAIRRLARYPEYHQVFAEWERGPQRYPTAYYHKGEISRDVGERRWKVSVSDWLLSEWTIIPDEIVLCAAADHCLAHAYAGCCPGVDPDQLMHWRAEGRAAFQRRPVEAVLADIEAAREAIRRAPRVVIAGVEVADFGYTSVPELPEASARMGVPILAIGLPDETGRRKQVLMSAPHEVIEAWPHDYGDPARGFAGRYL